MTFYFAMTNSWSLLYDELYGEDTMPEDKIEITTGAGNTANLYPIREDVPPDLWGAPIPENISINTSEFSNQVFNVPESSNTEESISIKTTDDPWVYESPDGGDTVTRRKAGSLEKEVIHGDYFSDSYPYVDTLNIDTSDYPSAFTTLSDNDDAIAHHITTPTPGIELDNPRKYKEDESIKALQDYISTTYGGHYTSENNNVQTLDLIESVGDAESFCRSNAIKYLSRYDKKGQAKRDILKALHYSLLLYHFSGQLNETTTRGYETF